MVNLSYKGLAKGKGAPPNNNNNNKKEKEGYVGKNHMKLVYSVQFKRQLAMEINLVGFVGFETLDSKFQDLNN